MGTIQIDLWFYFVSLIMVGLFVYMYVDLSYFYKYETFKHEMFTMQMEFMSEICKFLENKEDSK